MVNFDVLVIPILKVIAPFLLELNDDTGTNYSEDELQFTKSRSQGAKNNNFIQLKSRNKKEEKTMVTSSSREDIKFVTLLWSSTIFITFAILSMQLCSRPNRFWFVVKIRIVLQIFDWAIQNVNFRKLKMRTLLMFQLK